MKINIIPLLILLFFSGSLVARPFGFQSVSHINNAIKKQVRQAFIPTLTTKNEKIELTRLINFSSDKQLISFLTAANYISVWDFNKGKEIQTVFLNEINVAELHINNVTKTLFILDHQGKAYTQKIYSDEILKEYKPIKNVEQFSHLKTVTQAQILSSDKELIVVPNMSLTEPLKMTLEENITAIDISQDAKKIVVATNNHLYLFSLINFQQLHEVHKWPIDGKVESVLINNSDHITLKFETSFFNNVSHALLQTDSSGNYQQLKKFSEPIEEINFNEQGQAFVITQNNKMIFYSSQGVIDKIIPFDVPESTYLKSFSLKSLVFVPVSEQGMFIIDPEKNEKLLQILSTKNGWAVIDHQGRYDGNKNAIANISWEANDALYELDRFSEKYFEPGLLVKTLAKYQAKQKKISIITKPDTAIQKGMYLPPKISLLHEKQVSTKDIVTITIVAEMDAKDAVLAKARLYQNGKRISENVSLLNSDTKDKGQLTEKNWVYQITLTPGENNIQAQVSGWGNIYGESKPLNLYSEQSNQVKNIHINSVGINDYSSKELKLNFAENDARGFYSAITKFYKQSSEQKLSINKLVLNSKASRSQILSRLDEIKKQSTAQDILFLFLSGHGQAIDNNWYFLPQEAVTLKDPQHVQKVGLSSKLLSEKLQSLPNQQVVLLIDACQSGAITESFNNFHQRRELTKLSKETGVHILTATRADQLAPEYDQLGHGIFTFILLNGLKKNKKGFYNADLWPQDGQLMISELEKYIEKYVPITINILEQRRIKQGVSRGLANERTVVTPVATSIGQDFKVF
ncbi:MAG: caspase family protein [Gammaproteobacteria bacterium]|nr:caspase family protein [Gammaproteobacteria bacterium]